MLRKQYTLESEGETIRVFQTEGVVFINDMESGDVIAVAYTDVHDLVQALRGVEAEAGVEMEEKRNEDDE